MFNPDIQYRCTIIRGKAQKELDNLLPAYANIISEICPCIKLEFNQLFNERLSRVIYQTSFDYLSNNHQKTIRNHITEIAGKLFGLYFENNGFIYESQSNAKLLEDNDQPAFFKNLCLNFQFPNGMQKIDTVKDRLLNCISFKPFHFIISLLKIAKSKNVIITKDEIGYYVLNAKEVLQGKVCPEEVLSTILLDRNKNIIKKLTSTSKDTQHIREQLNLLSLANLIKIINNRIILNNSEIKFIKYIIQELNKPLNFSFEHYNLENREQVKKMYLDWGAYFSKIYHDENLLKTQFKIENKENRDKERVKNISNDLGKQGEEFVFNLEKERVSKTHPKLVNKIKLVSNLRGLGYDILSIEGNENIKEPEFARFIEVKTTIRTTEPDLSDLTWLDTINLTRKEWIAAKQYKSSYNIYRVYITPDKIVVRKINNPYDKSQNKLIQIIPTIYRMDFNSKSIDLEY